MPAEQGAASDDDRPLTDYEKGYLDGVLAYSYWSDGEVYVGQRRRSTYRSAVLRFLSARGINVEGWEVRTVPHG